MLVYISSDGDHAGRLIGQARLSDDVEAVRRISNDIERGNRLFKDFALGCGGNVIEEGGDECAISIPPDSLSGLPSIREQYVQIVGATVSVGVGMKLSESSKALLAAKIQGGDQILFYSPGVENILKEATQKQPNEVDKIAEAYLNKGEVVPFPSGGIRPASDKGALASVHALSIKVPGDLPDVSSEEATQIADDLLMNPATYIANKAKLLQDRAQTRKTAGFRQFNPGDAIEHVGSGRAGKIQTHEGPVRMPNGKEAKHVYGVSLDGSRGVVHYFEDELRLKKDEPLAKITHGAGGTVPAQYFRGHRIKGPEKPVTDMETHEEADTM